LHTDGDICYFEIQLEGFRGWQPACIIKAEVLAKYFASQADKNIRRKRQCRVEACTQKWTGIRPRRARTFLVSWHCAQPRQKSICGIHKEGGIGFLFAVTESGLFLDIRDLIGPELLSQRFYFAVQCTHTLANLHILFMMTTAT
jgi:hypothetical protein